MNKIKTLVFVSCVVSLNAFAQVPTESFKPLHQVASNIVKVNSPTPVSSRVTAENVVTPVTNPSENISNTKQPEVSVPNISVPNNMTDIQRLSSQSNEEYIKRRNSSFESELTKCIDEIPKNSKGQRSSESMLKCANVSKVHVPTTNPKSKPSYLTDISVKNNANLKTAIPEPNTAQSIEPAKK